MNDTTRRTGQSRGRAFTTDAAALKQPTHPTQEVAEAKTKAVAAPANDYGDDAGVGMEGITQDEMLIPFVRIVQPTAQILKEASPNYDENVRQGMMMNTALGTYCSRKHGFGFIPCFRDSSYTEWVPVDAGGGFRGTWAHDDPRVSVLLKEQGGFKALKTGVDGTELVETFSLYGVVVPRDEETGRWEVEGMTAGVIAFTSTQIKKYKQLITRLQALVGSPQPRYPMFCWRWNVTTQPEKNKKGDYYGWKFELAEDTADASRMPPSDPIYQMAREINQLVKSGTAKADFASSGVAVDASEGGTGAGQGTTIDQTATHEEEIPF